LFDTTVSINLAGAFYTTQHAARQMKLQGHGGSIIAISSISALVGGAQQTHYTPTKAGVLSLMQSCACALGKYGIRCNAILPGTIKTQLNEEDLNNEEKRRYMEGRIPLGRTGEPEDLIGPAVFLASEMAKYVVSFLTKSFCRAVLLMKTGRLERSCLLMGGCLLIYSKWSLNVILLLFVLECAHPVSRDCF
jgi:NAD(P)-dependent dehydrogenase (short-subunit alcohol dehydrogenase family)